MYGNFYTSLSQSREVDANQKRNAASKFTADQLHFMPCDVGIRDHYQSLNPQLPVLYLSLLP